MTLSEYTFRWRGLDDAPKWFAMRNTARRDIAAGRQHGQRPCCTRETPASVAKSATGGAVCPHVDGYQQYSIENQAVVIATYAELHKLTIVRTYRDEGESGLKIENRGGLTELVEDVQPDALTSLICLSST
ncbi:recombinase family protein [Bradyrhizobium yuanmingense]|uniref:recombinase family protein n=1 Tax=Bradyrhizobium yuanmingense TaxID=108015 RepID=UPI001CD81658|nr:recombinase family protein [Bradyrhizobium yuanmingense]